MASTGHPQQDWEFHLFFLGLRHMAGWADGLMTLEVGARDDLKLGMIRDVSIFQYVYRGTVIFWNNEFVLKQLNFNEFRM